MLKNPCMLPVKLDLDSLSNINSIWKGKSESGTLWRFRDVLVINAKADIHDCYVVSNCVSSCVAWG